MTHYEIFRECFPELKLTEEHYNTLAEEKLCRAFELPEGFALVKGNELRLLCVLPGKRGNGIGTRLFRSAEEYIRGQGSERMEIGGAGSGLLIGAPENTCGFFEKMGCTLDDRVAEMSIGELNLPDKPLSGADFGIYTGDGQKLHEAVAKVDPDWVQYFGSGDEAEQRNAAAPETDWAQFVGGGDVFCATVDGEIASFCILGYNDTTILNDGGKRMGSIGCVGTVPDFRRRGIGLEMVAEAAKLLLQRGCDDIFIHYTAVYDWYSRLGFKTRLFLKLGGKKL